jgi:hypothetical protein
MIQRSLWKGPLKKPSLRRQETTPRWHFICLRPSGIENHLEPRGIENYELKWKHSLLF